MLDLQVDGRKFTLGGKDFFYLADTVWSAFTNITMEEWEYYLDRRKLQGFNVLQINTLPQWDRSSSELSIYPFATEDGRTFTFGTFQESYFARAKQMCRMATEKGFHLALVLLWANYVPETWASKLIPDNVMPYDFIPTLIRKLCETFDEFSPIYVVSGDTDFESEKAVKYYECALDQIRELSPDTLKTFHIKGRYHNIPECLAEKADFYLFQSGHNVQYQDTAYTLAEYFYSHFPPKPVVNGEPCYEQMGYSRKVYGRFSRRDIRKAAWSSLLSGASAGVTYGAHGIWNWHKVGKVASTLGEGFNDPLPWEDAIKFPGAWDYGYLKHLFQIYRLGELVSSDRVKNDTKEIRCAEQADGRGIVIYLPSNTHVVLDGDFSDYDFSVIDLQTKNVLTPNIVVHGPETTIRMHSFLEDAVIIGQKDGVQP